MDVTIPLFRISQPTENPFKAQVARLLKECKVLHGLKYKEQSGVLYQRKKLCKLMIDVSFFYSWNAARIRAGMPDLRVHDLRHSFASFLVNAGRSLYEVQELLGHADIRTTSRYAHLSRERLIAAVEVVPLVAVEIKGLQTAMQEGLTENAVVVDDGSHGGQDHLAEFKGGAQRVADV